MAITHSIAHAHPGPPFPPGELLQYVNDRLSTAYTAHFGTFVTAFYGIYDPRTRELEYSSAGHNPPRRLRRDGAIVPLDGVGSFPLGVMHGERFEHARAALEPGEQLVFYTDGITEALNPRGELFGLSRLDEALRTGPCDPAELLQRLLAAVETFAEGRPPEDDQTLVVASVR